MMHNLHLLLAISMLMLSVIACGTSSPPAAQTPTSSFPTPLATASNATAATEAIASQGAPTSGGAPAKPEFTVAVIADRRTEQVTREQAQAAVDEASRFLREFSPYGLTLVDFAEDGNGGATTDMASRYAAARSAPLPNGLVIFSAGDNRQAAASGGYGYSMPVLGAFRNAFVSPVGGENQLYVAVVDYNYKYMACGYGGSDTAQSTVSLAGECRGQTGIACVAHNGYSMCSNAVGNLYTSTPTYAVSSMIVHGLLHNFGPGGDQDHYATPECNARMGYPAGFFDLQESEYYNGLCPSVYEEFTKSYRP